MLRKYYNYAKVLYIGSIKLSSRLLLKASLEKLKAIMLNFRGKIVKLPKQYAKAEINRGNH